MKRVTEEQLVVIGHSVAEAARGTNLFTHDSQLKMGRAAFEASCKIVETHLFNAGYHAASQCARSLAEPEKDEAVEAVYQLIFPFGSLANLPVERKEWAEKLVAAVRKADRK